MLVSREVSLFGALALRARARLDVLELVVSEVSMWSCYDWDSRHWLQDFMKRRCFLAWHPWSDTWLCGLHEILVGRGL